MAVRRVDVVQYGWNMFDRRMQQEILPYCEQQGVGFMATGRSPTACSRARSPRTTTSAAPIGGRQGNMGRSRSSPLFGPEKFKDNVRAVNELQGVAARTAKSSRRLALRWATSHPAVSTALSVPYRRRGGRQRRAVGWSISDADRAEIDAIFARHGSRHDSDYWIEEDR